MILISKYKDFYDHLIHFYGIDEKIVFHRDLPKDGIEILENKLKSNYIGHTGNITVDNVLYTIKLEFILFCGTTILVVQASGNNNTVTPWELVGHETDAILKLFKRLSKPNNHKERKKYNYSGFRLFFGSTPLEDLQFKESQELIELHRLLNRPVFQLTNKYGKLKAVTSMLLSDIHGFGKIMSAEQVYQKLGCFIGQQLTSIEPPITVTDKDRIVAHGFDLKTSFRGK